MEYVVLCLCLICIALLCLKGINLSVNVNYNYPEIKQDGIELNNDSDEFEAQKEILEEIRNFMLDEDSEA